MTATTVATIQCNECGIEIQGPVDMSKAALRTKLRREKQWDIDAAKDEDYCPPCQLARMALTLNITSFERLPNGDVVFTLGATPDGEDIDIHDDELEDD